MAKLMPSLQLIIESRKKKKNNIKKPRLNQKDVEDKNASRF
jgi:hypothetical protein